jgi:hypothetical protein
MGSRGAKGLICGNGPNGFLNVSYPREPFRVNR